MFTTKTSRIKIIFLLPCLIGFIFPSHSRGGSRGGFLYELFLRPDPDLEFTDLKDIKNFVKPELPVSTKQEAIKLALSNKDIQTQIFNSKMFDSIGESGESQITWRSYAKNESNHWEIQILSSSSIPSYECYFRIDNEGNATDFKPQQGCEYKSNK